MQIILRQFIHFVYVIDTWQNHDIPLRPSRRGKILMFFVIHKTTCINVRVLQIEAETQSF